MPLPRPEDLTSTVLRTDFNDDATWSAVQAAIDDTAGAALREAIAALTPGIDVTDVGPPATFASDPRFADVSIQALVDENNAAGDRDQLSHVFLADATSMTNPSSPLLLAVDLIDEPGRTFRVPARNFYDVSINLSIANMDFSDFANAADNSGIFRGLG